MWLYIGPEVIAPVLSMLATIGGVIMMFWSRVVAAAKALMGSAPAERRRTIGEEEEPA